MEREQKNKKSISSLKDEVKQKDRDYNKIQSDMNRLKVCVFVCLFLNFDLAEFCCKIFLGVQMVLG